MDKFLRRLKDFRGKERSSRKRARKEGAVGGSGGGGIQAASKGANSPTFRIIAFTAGVEMYAKALLEVLDPEGEIFDAQFYRDSCTLYGSAYVKVRSFVRSFFFFFFFFFTFCLFLHFFRSLLSFAIYSHLIYFKLML